jgi:hypothetical protein
MSVALGICDPRRVSYPYRLWLATFEAQIPDREIYARWNLKDEPTPTLDMALGSAAYLYVGAWGDEHNGTEPQAGLCPACRVFDWLYLRGTMNRFQAPILSARLVADLLHCFATRPDDLPALTVNPNEFSSFLTAHLGFAVLPEASGPAS